MQTQSPPDNLTKRGPAPPPTTPPPPPAKRHTWWLWLLVLVVIAGAGLWYFRSGGTAKPATTASGAGGRAGRAGGNMAVPVAVSVAKRGDVPVYQDGLGNVIAFYTVTVHTRVDGQLMDVPIREGELVTKGQLIAQVDPRPYQVQLEQAEGQMAHDEALLADAKLDLDRYKTLLQQDAIPRQQYDTQVATVGQYVGNIKQDQAAIDNAKLNLVYAKVTAPISGRVGLRLVDPGNIVHASDSTGLFVITQLQPIAALFTIPENNLTPVLQKLRARVVLRSEAWNHDRTKLLSTGKLLTVDNQIDPTTGTSKLKAVFENKDNALFPNQFINIRLLVDTLHNQVIVPAAAIQRGEQGTFAYVIGPPTAAAKKGQAPASGASPEQANAQAQKTPPSQRTPPMPGKPGQAAPQGPVDGVAQVRQVVVGITEGDNVSIKSGINAGDKVVVDGAERLQNGSPVRIRPTTSIPTPVADTGPGGPAS
jgi:multidrug efflux system membrane fusion protein